MQNIEKKSAKKIIVTGGLGVIGSRLSGYLRELGHDVLVTDKAILRKDGYERADITRYEELVPVFNAFKPDHVFHLAGEVGRENGEKFPRRSIEINESGTFNLAQLCLETGAKFYFCSTSEVYGKLGEERLTEDLADKIALRPTNVYGISKLHAENYLRHLCENQGLKALSFRFFMCYGPGEYPNPFRSAMTNFIDNLRRGKTISVHRGTKRSWCFIDDIVKGMTLSMNAPFEQYEAYNVGRDDLQPMERVAELIAAVVGANPSLINMVDPPGQFLTAVKNADFSKAKRHFGFESEVSVEEGIRRTHQWHLDNVSIQS
jgi:nucleoside-diphosphate-sugar epimerase